MVSVLVSKLLSLFLIMAGGYVLTKKGIVSREHMKGVTLVTVNLIIPCSMINAFRVQWTSDLGSGLVLSFGAAVAVNLMLVLMGCALKKPLGLNVNEQLGMIYPNSYNLTAPIVTAMLGPEYLIYCSTYMTVQTLLMWSHGRSVMSGERGFNLKKMFCTPQMCAIGIGILLLITGWELPGPVGDAVASVANMIGAISMLITGMLIGGMSLKQVALNKRVYLSVFLRLILAPLAEIALFKLTGAEKLVPNGHIILLVTLLGSATPAAQSLQQLATVYDNDAEYAGAINVMTMLLCIVTMPLMVMLYEAI